jgi:protein-arginine kinase activator protein McsA
MNCVPTKKCERCGSVAVVYLTEVNREKKTETCLCADCFRKDFPDAGTQELGELMRRFVTERTEGNA